jgi:hypothetical protein
MDEHVVEPIEHALVEGESSARRNDSHTSVVRSRTSVFGPASARRVTSGCRRRVELLHARKHRAADRSEIRTIVELAADREIRGEKNRAVDQPGRLIPQSIALQSTVRESCSFGPRIVKP